MNSWQQRYSTTFPQYHVTTDKIQQHYQNTMWNFNNIKTLPQYHVTTEILYNISTVLPVATRNITSPQFSATLTFNNQQYNNTMAWIPNYVSNAHIWNSFRVWINLFLLIVTNILWPYHAPSPKIVHSKHNGENKSKEWPKLQLLPDWWLPLLSKILLECCPSTNTPRT